MNKTPLPLLPLLYSLGIALLPLHAQAGSATWSSNPINSDWNNEINWTPNTVPNGPSDVATFDTSTVTNISTSAAIEVAQIVFNPAASSYIITCPQPFTLSGAGITNNSGVSQNFVSNTSDTPILFTNSATAGSGTNFTNNGGNIQFEDSSTASDATFTTTIWGGYTVFVDSATCGTATFLSSDGGTTIPALGANAIFTSTAGGTTFFGRDDSAGNATLIANDNGSGGGNIVFGSSFAQGGTARVELFGDSSADFSSAYEIQVGSIEGDGGTMEIGDTVLTVGTNNLSTAFAGVIQDQFSEEFGGTIVKTGTGTLTLSSAGTYRLATMITSGTLKVTNATGSATGTSTVSANGGTLAGKGIIAGATTIGSGTGAGGSLEPGKGASNPTTLTIQRKLTFKSDGTYIWKVNTSKAKADQVTAKGVTIQNGAQFNFSATANKKLAQGIIFTAIKNTATVPISGTFANLPDGGTITVGQNAFQASYEGGDGNDLTLTVL